MTKKEVLNAISEQLAEKKHRLLQDASDLSEAIAQDDKSSAGDKYETSREMSQQELDKVHAAIAENKRFENLVNQFSTLPISTKIQSGSLVKMAEFILFFGLPLGTLNIRETTIIGIGASAPLAQQLLGKIEGESIAFQGKQLTIISVE